MNSEPDDSVVVTVDHQAGQVSIVLPGVDVPVVLPTALVRTTSKVGDDGVARVTLRIRADEFHVRPAEAKEVVITDLPAPVTPEQAFEAQMAAIQRQAGYQR